MTDRPHVSVVVPAFNPGVRLTAALESIFSQGSAPTQVIVVNDGSTQDVEQVLEPFRPRLSYVVQTNRGPAAARNTGVELARGRYVAFLDADDLWPPNALGCVLEYLCAQPQLAGAHGLTQLMTADDTADETWHPVGTPWRSPQLGSVLVRREVARQFQFDETLARGEDFDWFVRVRDAGVRLGALEHVVLHYRIHGGNMTLGLDPEARNTFRILKRALDRRRSA